MTRLTTTDLSNIYRHALGADNIINRILTSIEAQSTQQTNYPPFNIIKRSDCETEVQVAVAGFNVEELDVSVDNGSLVITGEKYATDAAESVEYIHHGISARKFVRSWPLADNVEIVDAVVKDGILSVRVQRLIPESSKSKSIPIAYAS